MFHFAMPNLPKPPLKFIPVPLRARWDGWTLERQFGYLVALAAFGHCRRAARAVGMTEQSALRLRRRPQAAHYDRLCSEALMSAKKRRAKARLERLRGGSFPSQGKPKLRTL